MKLTSKFKEAVISFATEKHYGQKRMGGEDYITHCIAVGDMVISQQDEFLEIIRELFIGAMFHDLIEDKRATLEEILEFLKQFNLQFLDSLAITLGLLTHKEEDSYAEYIKKIITEPTAVIYTEHIASYMAQIIKQFDITHNLSILPNEKKFKARRDKYELALLVLKVNHGKV